jgi:hypothetical protein
LPSQRRSSYIFALNGAGAVQPNFDTPMPDASFDTAWDVSSDTLPGVEEEIARILDCTQQDLVALELLRRVMRWSVDFQADPVMLAIAVAYIESVAGAPTGPPRNQIQTIVIAGATSGTFRLQLMVGGYAKLTPPIPYNPTIADVKRAVESLTAIGRGQTVVANPSGTTFTVEIAGNLARATLPAMTSIITNLNGGASVGVSITQTAIQRAHAISRIAGYQPVAFGVMTGSKTSTRERRKWSGVVADSLRVGGGRATPRLTATLGVAGNADVGYADPSYTLPNCQIYRAARFLDCDLIIDGVSYQDNNLWRSFELRRNNGLIVDEDAQTSRDEDIHRAERADNRTLVIDASILGEEGDDIYEMAKYRQEVPVSLRVGRSGRNIVWTAPKAVLSLRNPSLSPDGTARRGAIQLSIEPELIPGDATTPYTIVANVEQSATLLTPTS